MDIHQPYLSAGARPVFRRGGADGCLCLHGFSAAPAEVDWLAEHLHTTLNMTTYTPRLAGHGSNPDDMARMRWKDWYLTARDGYQILADQCERVFVVGLSMGGLLALLVTAAQDTDITAAAILAAPTHFSNPNVERARLFKYVRRRAYTPDRTTLPQMVREEQYRRGEPVIGRTHYAVWSVSAIAELDQTAEAARSHLYNIESPLTLIYAQNDTAVPLACSDYIARHVHSDTVEQHTLSHTGHIITQDAERETAFHLIEKFFRRYIPHAAIQ